jgi:ABC-type polysaccharide/polyol phosphate export permease
LKLDIVQVFRDAFTIMEKELKLATRFKVPYFTGVLVNPLIRIFPFLLVYYGFFASGGATSFLGITADSYVPFLVIGMLVDVFLNMGYGLFAAHFSSEKVWHTVEATLLAPISKLSLLIGLWGARFVSIFPTILLFFFVAAWFYPTGLATIVFAFFILICTLSIASSIGLIHGSLVMANENFAPIFGYLRMGWVFASCFYYPLNILMFNIGQYAFDFRFVAFLNPVFHSAQLIRDLWMGNLDLSIHLAGNPGLAFGAGWQEIGVPLLFVVVCAVCFPLISVKVFNRLWKKMGIQGY